MLGLAITLILAVAVLFAIAGLLLLAVALGWAAGPKAEDWMAKYLPN